MRALPVLATVLALSIPALSAPALADEPRPTISVTGEGRVTAQPDMATISLGVTTEGDTAKAALDANTAALAAVIARLKEAGTEDKDIQTSGLSLGPRYDYSRTDSSGQNQITGYLASNMVMVRVRDLAVLGTTLDGAVADGANTLNGLMFGLQEPDPKMDEARKDAVADARHKAELYAGAAGVKLGRVLSISEMAGYAPPMPMMAEAAGFKDARASVPVEAGELGVTASVTILYEIAE